MRKPFLDESSHIVLALANAISLLKKGQPEEPKADIPPKTDTAPDLGMGFKNAAEQETQAYDAEIESNAIRIGGFLLRCLAGFHIGDETDSVEINYGYDADGDYHYFELYPEFCYNEEEFDNLNQPLQAAYLRITEKIKKFLEELSFGCDDEEGDIQADTGSFYFNTKTDLYKILARYATNRKIDINSIDRFIMTPRELDCFEGYRIDQKQHDREVTGLLTQRIEAIQKEAPRYGEELLRYGLQQSFVSLREFNASAYLVKHVNTTQSMNTALYFALLEEAAKLEEGINRDFEGACFDYRNTAVRPTLN